MSKEFERLKGAIEKVEKRDASKRDWDEYRAASKDWNAGGRR
jgi:hypothetical protein